MDGMLALVEGRLDSQIHVSWRGEPEHLHPQKTGRRSDELAQGANVSA